MVPIRTPCCKVVINRYWPSHAQLGTGILHVIDVFLVVKLWRMDTDHLKALIVISIIPLPHRGSRVDTINSAKGPELDHHDFAAQIGQFKWRRVKPGLVEKFGGNATAGQPGKDKLMFGAE